LVKNFINVLTGWAFILQVIKIMQDINRNDTFFIISILIMDVMLNPNFRI